MVAADVAVDPADGRPREWWNKDRRVVEQRSKSGRGVVKERETNGRRADLDEW